MKKLNKKAIADIILICSVVLFATATLFFMRLLLPKGRLAVISSEDGEIMRLPLSEDTEVELDSGHVIVIKNGEVDITYAPCPEKICENHSPISIVGESIICFPEKISVTVEERGD